MHYSCMEGPGSNTIKNAVLPNMLHVYALFLDVKLYPLCMPLFLLKISFFCTHTINSY